MLACIQASHSLRPVLVFWSLGFRPKVERISATEKAAGAPQPLQIRSSIARGLSIPTIQQLKELDDFREISECEGVNVGSAAVHHEGAALALPPTLTLRDGRASRRCSVCCHWKCGFVSQLRTGVVNRLPGL